MHTNFLFILFRCMAVRGELDIDALYQCREHTDVLVESIDLGVLWDEYGIVGDLVVCPMIVSSAHYKLIFHPSAIHKRFSTH